MVAYRVFDEIVDFITSCPNPEEIVNFKPTPAMQLRLSLLLEKKRTVGLDEKENAEIEQFMMVEHIMRLAKAKARKRMAA